MKNKKERLFEVLSRIDSTFKSRLNEQENLNTNIVYYRCLPEYIGKTILFEPRNYFEHINDEGNPVYNYGEYVRSGIKEISASKYIGGSVMGSFSMNRTTKTFYIYTINEKPDVDISHWNIDDFEYLQEVRYRKPVEGVFIGTVHLSDYLIKIFDMFYEYATSDGSDYEDYTYEEQQIILNIFQNGMLHQELKNLKAT